MQSPSCATMAMRAAAIPKARPAGPPMPTSMRPDLIGWRFSFGGENNPADDNLRGSHVSGTIGAVGNNGAPGLRERADRAGDPQERGAENDNDAWLQP